MISYAVCLYYRSNPGTPPVGRSIQIDGKQHYLWLALDQDREVLDVSLQAKRYGSAAECFFKRLLRTHGGEPRKTVTVELRSYGVAHRELIPKTIHSTRQYENNRAGQSHAAIRERERDAGFHGLEKSACQNRLKRYLS